MNNKDLLKVAIGMGFTIATKFDFKPSCKDVWIGDCSNSMLNSSCKIFNPTEGELMLWLLDIGWFELVGKKDVEFSIHINEVFLTSNNKSLKENLLSIILQVVEYE